MLCKCGATLYSESEKEARLCVLCIINERDKLRMKHVIDKRRNPNQC